jgi:hypothetical protein
MINPYLFDLSVGRVFYCQILRQKKVINENDDNGFITNSDILIFAFHHSAFDRSSASIFYSELCKAYNNIMWSENDDLFQYIDYSVHERLINMVTSREFWQLQLNGYNLERRLSLPVDHHRSSSDQRSGLASVAQISFEHDVATTFLDYASTHQLTPFQLGLTIFYAFLFKLTHGQNDLCIACLNANRYRTELQNMIGMFVATLPYHIQFDSRWSFDDLAKHVREKCLSILEHSHYPLQHILADVQLNQSNVSFLETIFDFMTVSSDVNSFSINGASLEQMSIEQSYEIAKFDFSMTFKYNVTAVDNQLSCSLICSQDIFDKTTVAVLSQRFQYLFDQIFRINSNVSLRNDCSTILMKKLSIILPEEAAEMEAIIFRRLDNIVGEGM